MGSDLKVTSPLKRFFLSPFSSSSGIVTSPFSLRLGWVQNCGDWQHLKDSEAQSTSFWAPSSGFTAFLTGFLLGSFILSQFAFLFSEKDLT